MTLSVSVFSIGPMGNNSYLVYDLEINQSVVIDPSFGSKLIMNEAVRLGVQITAIWLTHAHFDHIAGVAELVSPPESSIPVGIHQKDLKLYQQNGGADEFGLTIAPGPTPSLFFEHGQLLQIGANTLEVRHTPGHTPGHVVFYSASERLVFCGDLIFQNGIGRTDLPGGSFAELVNSIQTQIFTLPPETRLLPGHGSDTTVEEEREGLSAY